MNYTEEKKLKKEKRSALASMTDTEKLNYLVELLNKNVEMFTDCSDTYGINFTDEYNEQQEKIEELLDIIKQNK